MIKSQSRIHDTVRETLNQMRKRWCLVLVAMSAVFIGVEIAERFQLVTEDIVTTDPLESLIVLLPAAFVAFEVHKTVLGEDYGVSLDAGCSLSGFLARIGALSIVGWLATTAFDLAMGAQTNVVMTLILAFGFMVVPLVYFLIGTWLPASVVDHQSTLKSAFARGRTTGFRAFVSLIWLTVFAGLLFAPLAIAEANSETGVLWRNLTSQNSIFGERSGSDLIKQGLYAVCYIFLAVGDAVVFSRAYLVGEGMIPSKVP